MVVLRPLLQVDGARQYELGRAERPHIFLWTEYQRHFMRVRRKPEGSPSKPWRINAKDTFSSLGVSETEEQAHESPKSLVIHRERTSRCNTERCVRARLSQLSFGFPGLEISGEFFDASSHRLYGERYVIQRRCTNIL